jgi:tetratricopeptide (TPR) repeat protein
MSEHTEAERQADNELALAAHRAQLAEHPDDAAVHYAAACCCDRLGWETQAVPHYRAALAGALSDEDRRGAFLGLGSTLRALGEYAESETVFDAGLARFPEAKELVAFRAIAHYNLGRPRESVSALLNLLVETTADPALRSYARALRFYAENLDATWD